MWPFKKHQAVDRRSSPDRWDYVPSAGTAIRVTATLALAVVSIAILASCVSGEGPQAQLTTAPVAATDAPNLLHVAAKQAMLDIINAKRAEIGVPALTLGANIAAQIHAQSSLDNCFTGYWGTDGLALYMQYSLAGGYQAIAPGQGGLNYCLLEQPPGHSTPELRQVLDIWLSTPGNPLLSQWSHRINIGIAYGSYNFNMYTILEGDYVEYTDLPKIENDSLIISGSTKHDVQFDAMDQLGIDVFYDPPPEPLTIGQLSRGACFTAGALPIAILIPLSNVGYYQTETPVVDTYQRCTPPREISADSPGPGTLEEALLLMSSALNAGELVTNSVPQIRSSKWEASGNGFAVSVDIGDLLEKHGAGVYTVSVSHYTDDDEERFISQYSIFYGITPPDTYGAGLQPAQ